MNYICLLRSFIRTSWKRLPKRSASIGLLLSIIASAKTELQPTPIPDLWTYLASDKLLAPVLVVTLGNWLTTIAKWFFSNEKKDRMEIKAAVSHIPQILEWQRRMERHIEKIPTEDKIDYKILKALTDKDL